MDKLSANIVIRVSTELKTSLEALATAYRIDMTEVVRRTITDAVEKWEVPGFLKVPRKPK